MPKKKNGNARESVFYCRRICRIDRAWHGVRGWRHTVERWNRGSRRSNRNGESDTRLPTVDKIDWFFSRRNDFGSETRSDDRWNDFESWMCYSATRPDCNGKSFFSPNRIGIYGCTGLSGSMDRGQACSISGLPMLATWGWLGLIDIRAARLKVFHGWEIGVVVW